MEQDKHTKIDQWRQQHAYTQLELATELGVSHDLIHRLCAGSREPSLNVQIRFVNRFGKEEAARVFDDSRVLAVLETA